MPRSAVSSVPRQLVRDFGTCLRFDGVDDEILITSPTALQTSVFTYTAWVKPSTSVNQAIIGDSKGSGTRGLEFRCTSANKIELLEENVASIGTSTGSIIPKQWNFVAVSYDVSGNYAFYINGVAAGSGTNLRTLQHANKYIGRQLTAEFFLGLIDDVRIYNSALTSTEIINLYYGINPSSTPVGWYKFDEGSGTTATDSGSGAVNGVITGATYSTDVFIKPRTVAGTRIRVRNQGNAVRTVAASTQSVRWTNTPFLSPTVVSANMWLKLRAQTASTFDVPFGFGNTRWFFIFNGTSNRPAFNTKISTVEKSSGYITKALTLNKWFFLSGTYDPNAGANNLTIRVYDENGVLYDSISSTQTGDMDSTAQPLCFGNDPVRGFNMSVDGDDIRVFSRALTSTEQDLLAKGYPVNTSGLELWAKCDESSGDLADSSGNSRTGTNNNTCTFVSSFMTAVRTAA